MPPKWLGLGDRPLVLDRDAGTRLIDQNGGRWPDSPMEPLMRAILHMQPNYDFRAVDIITDRHTLASFLQLAPLKGEDRESEASFEFGVQVVEDTLIFLRLDSPTSNQRSFREGFEKAVLEQYEGYEDCQAHHRIVECSLGDLRVLLRYGADAYVLEDTREFNAAMSTMETRPGSPHVLENITVQCGGALLPQSAMVEFVTVKQGPRGDERIWKKYRETYISGAPRYAAAEYFNTHTGNDKAIFLSKNLNEYNSAVGTHDDALEVSSPETIAWFKNTVVATMGDIRELVEKGNGRYYRVRFSEGKLVIQRSLSDGIPGLSAELCGRWRSKRRVTGMAVGDGASESDDMSTRSGSEAGEQADSLA